MSASLSKRRTGVDGVDGADGVEASLKSRDDRVKPGSCVVGGKFREDSSPGRQLSVSEDSNIQISIL